jgi:hypothetical protein
MLTTPMELVLNRATGQFLMKWCPRCGEGQEKNPSKYDMLFERCYSCDWERQKRSRLQDFLNSIWRTN